MEPHRSPEGAAVEIVELQDLPPNFQAELGYQPGGLQQLRPPDWLEGGGGFEHHLGLVQAIAAAMRGQAGPSDSRC